MSLQYPHYLYKVEASSDSTRDDDGNWVAGSATPVLVSICREEKAGKGNEIQGADGKKHVYNALICAPLSCADIAFGTEIFVKASETATEERIRGSVKLFDRGQLHSRIWV